MPGHLPRPGLLEGVLLCNACYHAVGTNSFPLADRPALKQGRHEPCKHCGREGVAADPKRSAARLKKKSKNHNYGMRKGR